MAGGKDVTDVDAIFARLDRARAKHRDMVLVHGGGPGVERIAAKWAERHGVHQVVCKPDWNAHGRAAPFRRNDDLLNLLPKGVITFPGRGSRGSVAGGPQPLVEILAHGLAVETGSAADGGNPNWGIFNRHFWGVLLRY